MKTSVLLSWEIPENYNSAMPFKVSCFLMCKVSWLNVERRGQVSWRNHLKTTQTALIQPHIRPVLICGFHITDEVWFLASMTFPLSGGSRSSDLGPAFLVGNLALPSWTFYICTGAFDFFHQKMKFTWFLSIYNAASWDLSNLFIGLNSLHIVNFSLP